MDVLMVVLFSGVTASAYTGAESPYTLGAEPKNRDKTDQIPWTLVSKDAVCEDGEVRQVQVYSGRSGHPLHIGVYRPTGAATCHFRLVQQITWTSPELGLNVVNLTGAEVLHMKVGDHYGFSWPDNGTIMYDTMNHIDFCENEGVMEVDEIKSLMDMRYGDREYSLQLLFHPMNSAGIKQKLFKLRSLASSPPEAHDVLPTAGTSSHLSPASVTSCACTCQLTAGCVSFRWKESTGGCQLLASSYNEASSPTEQDWKLYACPFLE